MLFRECTARNTSTTGHTLSSPHVTNSSTPALQNDQAGIREAGITHSVTTTIDDANDKDFVTLCLELDAICSTRKFTGLHYAVFSSLFTAKRDRRSGSELQCLSIDKRERTAIGPPRRSRHIKIRIKMFIPAVRVQLFDGVGVSGPTSRRPRQGGYGQNPCHFHLATPSIAPS